MVTPSENQSGLSSEDESSDESESSGDREALTRRPSEEEEEKGETEILMEERIGALRARAAKLLDAQQMVARAERELSPLIQERMARDADLLTQAAPSSVEIEQAQPAALREFRAWLNVLPQLVIRSLSASCPLAPWVEFHKLYGGGMLDVAKQLFAIPAGKAEAERVIKIVKSVIGKHGSQMDNATLIARVRLVMQALQMRRDAMLRRRGQFLDPVRAFDERPQELPSEQPGEARPSVWGSAS
jgi:hypothetical protein